MKKFLFLALTILFSFQMNAQEQTIDLLRKQLEVIEAEEKKELKQQVENINSMFENGVISEAEADRLKLKAAETRAKKIEERQAVILETISYLEKKAPQQKIPEKDPDIFLDIDSYFNKSIEPRQPPVKEEAPPLKTTQPEKPLAELELKSPTTLDLVIAYGLNNAVEGSSLEELDDNRDFSISRSHFLEMGLALKTPLMEENWLRLKYGLSYQANGLKPSGNRFFVETDGQTELQEGQNITASSFTVHNLIVPVHLEFGPTKKKQNENYSYYSAGNQLKIAIGGYAGISMSARQKIEYPILYHGFYWIGMEEYRGYDINKQIYGLSAYAGIGAFSVYGKYDLNPIFKNGAKDQQFISLGLRVDL